MLGFVIFITFLVVVLLIHILRYIKAPRILLYHNVSDNLVSNKTNISTFKFEQHIKMLKKLNFTFYTMNELFDEKEIKKTNRRAFLTFDDSLETLYKNVFPILKKYNIKATIYMCESIKGEKLLSKEQIEIMQNSGLLEFGSHTTNHINMLEYSDNIVNEDIKKSKLFVENITKKPCTTFAYPYGRYNKNHCEMLETAGYKTSVIIGKRLENYANINKFEIPRIEPRGNMNILQFVILLFLGKYKI